MTTVFPTALDSLTNPAPTSLVTAPPHSAQHADANDAIEALEAKVGVNGSAVTTTLDYRVAALETETPAGVSYAVQYNNGGTLAGDATNFNYGVAGNKFVGVQKSAPEAPLHAAGVTGLAVATPASLTATPHLDSPVDSPTSYAAPVQITTPSDPTSLNMAFSYIDYPYDGGGFQQYENSYTMAGFTCYGQTITGNIYCYRNTTDQNGAAVKVINPTGLAFSVADAVNDGMSFWTIHLGSWVTSAGNYDGFIVIYSDPYSGSGSVDISTSTSYDLSNTGSTVSYQASTYQSTGTSWGFYVAQYKNLSSYAGGTKYRGGYQNTSNTDAGVSGNYLILNNTWSGLVDDGFVVGNNASAYWDIGTAYAFNDWGQGLSSDMAYFGSYAFPSYTSPSDGSFNSATQSDGSGSYTASGGSYNWTIYEYVEIAGVKYFNSGYNTGAVYDNTDGQPFTWGVSLNPGSGTGRVWVNQSGQGADIGGAGSFSDDGNYGTAPSVSLTFGSYPGFTRNFSAYGDQSSPSLKYSSTHNDVSFTDNNPVGGYMIAHSLSTFGNATGTKIIEVSYGRDGSIYDSIATTSNILQYNYGLGSNTVTPANIGFLSSGQAVTYNVWADKTINGTLVYSPSYATTTYTFPNDGLYRYLTLTCGAVSGAAYKFQKVGTGYLTTGSISYDDTTSTSYGASSTVTPISAPVAAGIFERNMSGSYNETPICAFRNSNGAGQNFGFNAFYYTNGGGVYGEFGRYGVTNSGYFAIDSYNHGLEIGSLSAPHVYFHPPSNNVAAALFNAQGNSQYIMQFQGYGVSFVMVADALSNTVYFGNNANNYPYGDPLSAIAINPVGSDKAIDMIGASSVNPDAFIMKMRDYGNATLWTVSNQGKMGVACNSHSQSNLRIGGGSNLYTQLSFDNTGTLPSSPVAGGFERYDNLSKLYWTDKNNVRTIVLRSPTTITTGGFFRSDVDGDLVLDNSLVLSGGTLTFNSSITPLFANGLSVSSGKNISMGSGSSYIGGLRTGYATAAVSTSLNVTNHSPIFVFTGSTAGRTLTLPTAASISGSVFEISNEATVSVTVATTSSQNMNIGTGTVTTLVLQPGDRAKFIATASSTWDVTNYDQWIQTAVNGGTGHSVYAVGDLPYANTTTTLAKLADVATGNALISGGVNTAPSWGKIALTTHVSGTLPVANGGTGQTSVPIKFTHYVDANNSGTAETDLYSDTLAAGQLVNNGDIVEAQYGGIFTGAATATQQLKVKFGGTTIFDSGALSIGALTVAWNVYTTVMRVSSSVVRCSVSLTTSFASLSAYTAYTEVTGLTLGNTQIIKITGTAAGVGGASNQITAKEGFVEYKPSA